MLNRLTAKPARQITGGYEKEEIEMML